MINTELQRNLLISLRDLSPNLLRIFSVFTQYPAHLSYIILKLSLLWTQSLDSWWVHACLQKGGVPQYHGIRDLRQTSLQCPLQISVPIRYDPALQRTMEKGWSSSLQRKGLKIFKTASRKLFVACFPNAVLPTLPKRRSIELIASVSGSSSAEPLAGRQAQQYCIICAPRLRPGQQGSSSRRLMPLPLSEPPTPAMPWAPGPHPKPQTLKGGLGAGRRCPSAHLFLKLTQLWRAPPPPPEPSPAPLPPPRAARWRPPLPQEPPDPEGTQRLRGTGQLRRARAGRGGLARSRPTAGAHLRG